MNLYPNYLYIAGFFVMKCLTEGPNQFNHWTNNCVNIIIYGLSRTISTIQSVNKL